MKPIAWIGLGVVLVAVVFFAVTRDSGPLKGDRLADAADEICAEYEERFARSGNIGVTNPQIADEIRHSNELARERQAELRELEVDEEDADEWQVFLASGDRFLEINEEIVEAAERDDTRAVNAGFADLTGPAIRRGSAAEELGMEVCGVPPEPEVELTETGPADDVNFVEPETSIDEVAEEFVTAVADEDCEAAGALAHSNLGWFDQGVCAELFSTMEGAELLGSEAYGPAGVAEVESEFGDFFTLYFVTGDDDVYRYAGHVTNDDRGLRPANEEADVDAAVEEILAVVAEGDEERRQELLADPDYDPVPVELERALEQGAEPEIDPLGINQALAFQLVEVEGATYVLVFSHMPGGRSEYRISDVVMPAMGG